MDEGKIDIRFDGKRYLYWQDAEIRASVDDLCAQARLSVTLPGHGATLPVTPNSVIEIFIAKTLVATVRLDSLSRRVGKDSHEIHLAGRSLARELVDSQYSKVLSGLTLEDIAKTLCEDFKVPLVVKAETVEVPEFAMQCESPAGELINAARTLNLLLYALPNGGLMLTEPDEAAPVTSLIYGVHILDYEVVDEYRLRFSEYCLKGYDTEDDEATSAEVKDSGIGYFRPMHISADRYGQNVGGCERRAQLERDRRAARAHRIEITVQGWRFQGTDGFQVWQINTRVRVVIPQEGINEVFLIGEVALMLSSRGALTRLTLMRRDAFLGIEKNRKKGNTEGDEE